MRIRLALAAAALTFVSSAAIAAQSDVPDPYASGAILRGDYARAEAVLMAQHTRAPEAKLNLAVVYAHTGRTEAARSLYKAVLAQPDVALELPSDQIVNAHVLANAGLAKLPIQQASR